MNYLDNHKEKLLLKHLKNGIQEAYKYLYDTYYSELCTYAAKLCCNDQLAQDIVQQVMIKLWKKRQELSIKDSLKKYLYKAVYYQFIDNQRRTAKEMNLLDELKQEAILELIEAPQDDFEKKYHSVEVEINKLPTKCKKVFLLGKKEGLKYKEIATKLNISIKTVESHMSLALRKLRKALRATASTLLLFLFL